MDARLCEELLTVCEGYDQRFQRSALGESRDFAQGGWNGCGRCLVSLARVHDGCWTLAAETDRQRRAAASLGAESAWLDVFRRSL